MNLLKEQNNCGRIMYIKYKKTESRCKPGSVENHHSSRPRITPWLEHPTRLHGLAALNTDLFGLASRRVYLVSLQPNCTCFLLHLSSPHGGRALPATLPYNARTFLPQINVGGESPLSVKSICHRASSLVNKHSFC